jgi:hypothetical protein
MAISPTLTPAIRVHKAIRFQAEPERHQDLREVCGFLEAIGSGG